MMKPESKFPTDRYGWAELLPARIPRPALDKDTEVDWVVVGAGVTGLSCARRLAELHPGQEIVLLDAREIGQGATARSSGVAVALSRSGGPIAQLDMENAKRINRINQAGLNRLRQTIRAHQIACDWTENGVFHVAADQHTMTECEHFQDYLNVLNVPHKELSCDELKARTGTGHYKKGVHVPEGALVQPALLVRGLADTLPENVQLYENTPVLEVGDGQIIELTTPNARIRAKSVILATNYEVSALGFLKSRITGVVLSGSFTRALTQEELSLLGSEESWGCLSLHESGATVRLTVDRRICIRNTVEFKNSSLLSEKELEKRQRVHRKSFTARFPQLSHVPFEFSWSGVEGVSRNRTNFIEEVSPRVWFAGGYNGSGITRGTAFGEAVADLANGNRTELAEDCGNVVDAKWMPPEPFRTLGGNFVARRHNSNVGKDA